MRSLLCFTLLSLLALTHCQLTTTCQTSSDCPTSKTCEQNVCVRENLFPLYPKEVLATFISVVINVFLNIGGVGGGAVHIPYIHLLYEVTMAKAVTISFACVFGASLAYVFCTVPIKDAPTNRYLINYDISLIALPALMVGVGIGSIVTRFFPPLMTSIIVVFVLGYAILKNAFKFKAAMSKEIFMENGGRRKAYQVSDAHSLEVKPKAKVVDVKSVELSPPSIQEVMSKNDLPEQEQGPVKEEESSKESDSSKDEDSIEEQDEVPSPIKVPEPSKRQPAKNLLNKRNSLPASLISLGSATTFDRTYSRVLSIVPTGKDNAPLTVNDQIIELPLDMVSNKAEQLSDKEKNFPVKKLVSLLVNVLSIFVFGLIRGTKNFKSIFGVQWSLTWDLIWFSLGTLCFCLATIKSIYDVLKSQKEKQDAKYEFLPHEPILTRQNLKALLIRAVIGGFASAVSTLAGAFILGPALGDMGMPAPFAAATTNMIMILSMFNAMLAILLNGSLSIEETIWFMFFSALLGMTVVRTLNGYVKKTGRESTVIGMIIIGTIIGVMCLISTTMQSLMENLPASIKFGSY